MELRPETHYLFKIIMIGDSHVGKSSLLLRQSEKTYKENYLSTIGLDFKQTSVDIDNSLVQLQIWDTAGQERFRTIINNYYRGAEGAIIVFDKSDRTSFDNVDDWINELEKYAVQNPIKVLVGNKSDIKSDVGTEEGKLKAVKYKMDYIETSAKEDYQVEALFQVLASRLISKGALRIPKGNKIKNVNAVKKRGCCRS
ncbi:rab1_2 [Blepharisma stoltei]|uniref:Uncharacterized protein n=1 Tax=Blepharisma stoltei TaxID=1481888 RepID=A0AAU9ISF2_9CILI|nr:unnamed protein product [Blepharisma stoltei]